jgi:hypothetical protein
LTTTGDRQAYFFDHPSRSSPPLQSIPTSTTTTATTIKNVSLRRTYLVMKPTEGAQLCVEIVPA